MNKDSLILCFVNMMSSMGYSLIAPLYPSLARSKGVNDDICGVIIAIFALTSICISPFIPTLINMFGKRNVLYSSILLSVRNNLLNKGSKFFIIFLLGTGDQSQFIFITLSHNKNSSWNGSICLFYSW